VLQVGAMLTLLQPANAYTRIVSFRFCLVGDELVSSIGKGICVLLGISREDDAKDTEFM